MKSRVIWKVAKDEVLESHASLFHVQQQIVSSLSSAGERSFTPHRGVTIHSITGYSAAVIKVPFQHSTHRDLFQSKHSSSQLNPRPLHWTFLCLRKSASSRKKCVISSAWWVLTLIMKVSQQLWSLRGDRIPFTGTTETYNHNICKMTELFPRDAAVPVVFWFSLLSVLTKQNGGGL